MADAQKPPVWLKVCTTCDRHAAPPCRLGEALAASLAGAVEQWSDRGRIAFRRVPCLSGCLFPGNIALGASDKVKIRLNRLGPGDADEIAELVGLYLASADGDVPETDWPDGLKGHLAARIEPRSTGPCRQAEEPTQNRTAQNRSWKDGRNHFPERARP